MVDRHADRPVRGCHQQWPIQTFNNRQGAGNASGAVTYAGTLPGNCNIIIDNQKEDARRALDGARFVVQTATAAVSDLN